MSKAIEGNVTVEVSPETPNGQTFVNIFRDGKRIAMVIVAKDGNVQVQNYDD
jgi:hypothetical protein